jgi:uncharacterized protein with von Willebrand factor type A (vWA) domain
VRARLHGFVGGLREAGVDVSVAESLDAMHAVAAVGVERERLREALAAALVKDERDRALFDDLFERHFPLPAPAGAPPPRRRGRSRGASVPGAGGRGAPAPGTGARSPAPQRPQGEPGRAGRPGPEPDARRETLRRGRRRAHFDELRHRAFRELTAEEVGELRELIAVLAEQLKRRLARRWRLARRGSLDLRRTLRAATATGGVPLRLGRRQQRPARPDLLALCDVSGSVAAASELLLALIAPARRYFRRALLYVYVDRLCPVAIEDGRLVPERPLDLYAHSDFGRVLVELWTARPPLSATTLVLVLGDARNNRRPPRADLLRALRGRTQRLVWIVPEPRVRWNTGDSALAAYARWCDAVHECVDVDGLARAVRQTLA